MINRVVLAGRLTKDPVLRSTQSGLQVAQFTLAVNRNYTNGQGQRTADFVSCVIWRKGAEILCKYAKKGELLGVDGRIQTRTYDDKDGKRVYVTEVVIDNFSFLEPKKDQNNGTSGQNNNTNTGYQNDASNNKNGGTTSHSQASTQNDPFTGAGDTIDISDDDLPF